VCEGDRFNVRLQAHTGGEARIIHFGRPHGEQRYEVLRECRFDADAGRFVD
jgi:hypothetical protein